MMNPFLQEHTRALLSYNTYQSPAFWQKYFGLLSFSQRPATVGSSTYDLADFFINSIYFISIYLYIHQMHSLTQTHLHGSTRGSFAR